MRFIMNMAIADQHILSPLWSIPTYSPRSSTSAPWRGFDPERAIGLMRQESR